MARINYILFLTGWLLVSVPKLSAVNPTIDSLLSIVQTNSENTSGEKEAKLLHELGVAYYEFEQHAESEKYFKVSEGAKKTNTELESSWDKLILGFICVSGCGADVLQSTKHGTESLQTLETHGFIRVHKYNGPRPWDIRSKQRIAQIDFVEVAQLWDNQETQNTFKSAIKGEKSMAEVLAGALVFVAPEHFKHSNLVRLERIEIPARTHKPVQTVPRQRSTV